MTTYLYLSTNQSDPISASQEQDESEIKLILPCDKARRLEDLDWSVLGATTEPTEPTETEPGSHGLRKRRAMASRDGEMGMGRCLWVLIGYPPVIQHGYERYTFYR